MNIKKDYDKIENIINEKIIGSLTEWAKEYCKNAVFAIYDEDDEFDEDELIKNIHIYSIQDV